LKREAQERPDYPGTTPKPSTRHGQVD